MFHREPISRPATPICAPVQTSTPSPVPPPASCILTVEKSTQTGDFVQDTFTLGLLETRHCDYMLEVFGHLQFSIELLSPFEIERPKRSKLIPLSGSKAHAEHRLRLRGSIADLNTQLADILIHPKSAAGHLLSLRNRTLRTISKPNSPRVSSSPKPTARPSREQMKPRTAAYVMPATDPIPLNFHIRLKTIDPFIMQQTRPLPASFHPSLRLKYCEIEHIQTLMPEVADIRFNLSDVLRPDMRADEFYVQRYFTEAKPQQSEEKLRKVEAEVMVSLRLYRFMLRRKGFLRSVFVSYNMESMQAVTDMLSMDFATFVRLLKDCLLITPAFDLLSAAKIFYLSSVKSKEMPVSDPESQRKWLKHLLNSYEFRHQYRLRLPHFLESIARLAVYHPRFHRLALAPDDKLHLLYRRNLKPNARLAQGSVYKALLEDIHISGLLQMYQQPLFELFQGYTARLTVPEKVCDFIGKDGRMDLHRFYSFLSNAGLLMDAEIVAVGNDDIEEEIERLNDFKPAEVRTKLESPVIRRNQAVHAALRETTIRFPSSMLERLENKHLKLRAARNTRISGFSRDPPLLPFYRPLRNSLQVDKLTAFSLFVAVMKAGDAVFLLEPERLDDSDFCIDFDEFVQLVGMLGILYWKTVRKCLDFSLAEGVGSFLKGLIEVFKYMREFRTLTTAERTQMCKELLRQTVAPLREVQTKPMITKALVPQERFVQRRDSI